jgi:hypothetical protein
MGTSKTQVEPTATQATPNTIAEKLAPAPEQHIGPALTQRITTHMPPPNGPPPTARAGDMMNSPEASSNAPKRAQMSAAIQRQQGNLRTSSLLRMPQEKIAVGTPGDHYEQEADEVARRVVSDQKIIRISRIGKGGFSTPLNRNAVEQDNRVIQARPANAGLQRMCDECSKELESPDAKENSSSVQRKTKDQPPEPVVKEASERDEKPLSRQTISFSKGRIQRFCNKCAGELKLHKDKVVLPLQEKPSSSLLLPVGTSVKQTIDSPGAGSPVSEQIRAKVEPIVGADLSRVRVHSDNKAQVASRQLNAKAFTHQQNIYLGQGQSAGDAALMAHELTHTVQQRGPNSLRPIQCKNDKRSGGGDEGSEIDELVEVIGSESLESGTESAAKTSEVSVEGETETPAEVEIPTFDAGEDEACPKLVSSEPLIPEGGSGGKESGAASGYSRLVELATSFSPSFSIIPGWMSKIVGRGALWAWRRLPLWIRAKAVNMAIDLAISGVEFVPKLTFGGGVVLEWIQAGMLGFLRRLRRYKDRLKVQLFEKYIEIISGQSSAFSWAYLKGLLQGFFIDGLIGIIQMIIDIICLVGKFPKLIGAIEKFFAVFPDEMARVYGAILRLNFSIAIAAENVGSEVKALVSNPKRILGFIDTAVKAVGSVSAMIGEKIAEGLVDFMKLPPAKMGKAVGRIAGMALFEALMTVLTSGGGAAVTGAKILVRGAIKLMVIVGKRLLTVLKFVGSILKLLAPYVVKAKPYLTPLLKNVASALHRVLRYIGDFLAAIFRRCRPGSVICSVDAAKYVLGPRSTLINAANRRLIARLLKNGKAIGLDIDALKKIVSATRSSRAGIGRVLKHLDKLAKHKIPGSSQVIGDLMVAGNKSQGARFVLRYIDDVGAWKHVKHFEFTPAAGGRRWDAIIKRTRYQFKDWGAFKNKTFADQIMADLKLTSLNRLRWVFSSRLGNQAEIVKMMTDVLLDPKYGVPRKTTTRIIAKLEKIVIVH